MFVQYLSTLESILPSIDIKIHGVKTFLFYIYILMVASKSSANIQPRPPTLPNLDVLNFIS